MFTGIIKDIGTVMSVDTSAGDTRIVIQTGFDLSSIEIGASICCSGCCLTVVEKTEDTFSVDVSAETLSKTNLGEWKEGSKVNLELSLKMGDELGGHIVSGHVDGLAKVVDITPEGDSHRIRFDVPDHLKHFMASKGSVALDGISLTVNEVEDHIFGINVIPHTWTATTLGQVETGDSVNIEVDMMARYVARMLGKSEA